MTYARSGLNFTETILTQSNVNVHSFGLLRNLTVDGKVDARAALSCPV